MNGIAAEWAVKEGDIVGSRTALLRISGLAAQLQAENAAIVAQNAARKANSRRLAELLVNVEDAKMRMDQEAVQLQRQRNLWAQQIGSRNELEQRELAWKSARNTYEAARLRYAELQREIGFGEKQAMKNLEISRSAVNDYTVRSESGGRLYFTFIEAGEMVNTQQPIAIIGHPGAFILELQVDEYDVARIKRGQYVAVSMDSYKGQVFEAVVEALKPYMHERTKTFTVEARFLQPPPALYPNLTCEANIIIAHRKHVLTIPRACLLDGNYVTLENGEKKKVSTGLMDYQKVEITEGLTSGDIIINPEK